MQILATVSYEEALTPKLYGRVEATAQRSNSSAEAYASTAFGGGASLTRDVRAATIYARVSYLRTIGDEPFALFGATRRDDRIDLSLGASWKRWSLAGMTPVVRFQQTFHDSPLALYDFKRTRVEVALTERF